MKVFKLFIGLGIFFLASIHCFAQTIPSIISVSPESGAVGSTVTIKGTNFRAIAIENIVYFGAVKAVVNSASATELSVTVPSGATYMPISVTVAGLTAFGSKPFQTTFPSNKVIDFDSFNPKVDFSTGNTHYAIAIGDIDGDGNPDLVVTNSISNSISIFRNTGTSGAIRTASFDTKVDFATGLEPGKLVIGDVDRDGKLDIVVANRSGGTVSVYKNISTKGSITDKSLAPKVDFVTGGRPNAIVLGDLDKDGRLDLVATETYNGSIAIFQNVGVTGNIDNQTFSSKINIPLTSIWDLDLADMDADGKLDLVATSNFRNVIAVIKNNYIQGVLSINSFSKAVEFRSGTYPAEIAIGDLNSDGKPEIVAANINGSSVSIFENKAVAGSIDAASFAAKVDLSAPANTGSVAIGDIDGDGKPDLAIASGTSNNDGTASVFKNLKNSGIIDNTSFFSDYNSFTVEMEPYSIAIGDLNADQKPDLVTANANTRSISVLANKISTPTVSAISILNQPFNKVGCMNDTASFKIVATGAMKYQWQFQASQTSPFEDITNTSGYSGATSATLTISGIVNSMSGSYRCKLSANNVSDVFSTTVLLNISKPSPTIITKDKEACSNSYTLIVQGYDQYKWSLANAVAPDTLKILSQNFSQQGQFVQVNTQVGNFKEGISKLYLTSKNSAGCTRLDSTNLSYFPNEKASLSNEAVVGDSVLLKAIPILRGNTSYSGTWSIVQGEASIRNKNANSTYAKLYVFGEYKFIYTSSDSCKTKDTITVFRTNATVLTDSAKAGDDVYACSSNATMAATKPTKAGFKGRWTIEKGSLKIENDTLYNSPITGINDSISVLVWTVRNTSTLASTSDKVQIFRAKVKITEPGLSDTVFVPSKTFIINAKIQPFGSHVWYVNNVLQDNAPLRSNAGLPKDTSVFKIITNIVDCELADSVVVIFKDTKVITNAGRDSTICADTATLAATAVPQGYIGVWRSGNPKVKFSDSTKVNAKVSGLVIGRNELFWLAKSGNEVRGRDTLVLTSIAGPSSSIPDYHRICPSNPAISFLLKNNETISFTSINNAEIVKSDFGINRYEVFNLARFPNNNVFNWTLSNRVCTKTGQLTFFLSDTVLIENKPVSGIAGDTIKVKVSDVSVNSLFSKTEWYDSLIVEEIAGTKSGVVLKKYTVGDTMVNFVTNRKLISKETYWYRLRNSCGYVSDTGRLIINTINVIPEPRITRNIPLVEGQKIYKIRIKLVELDRNRYLDTIRLVNAPIGVVAKVSYPDSLSVIFEIDLTNALASSESQTVLFRFADTQGSGELIFVIPGTSSDLVFYNALSPNDDGKNDVFEIDGITLEKYRDNKVEIFNRWGDRVYRASNYNNKEVAFDGDNLPDGTYYYIVQVGEIKKLFKGFLVLKR